MTDTLGCVNNGYNKVTDKVCRLWQRIGVSSFNLFLSSFPVGFTSFSWDQNLWVFDSYKLEYWKWEANIVLLFSKYCMKVTFISVFFFLIFTLFYFTILYWFCHTLTWIHHGCTCIPKHEPPSHLPPHNISLGHPRAPAPSILYPALDIDWRFLSYMIVYMFQCHSPKSSHTLPLPLPLSPKVRSTHLCLFCCLAYRVIVAIFLNSIHMC